MSRIPLRDLQAALRANAPQDWDESRLGFMGKKAREYKPRQHKEHDEQAAMVSWLHLQYPHVVVSASLNGELWAAARHMGKGPFFGWMNKLKARGLLAGMMDLTLFWKGPRVCLIECKVRNGREAEHQEQLRLKLTSMGHSVYVCRSIEELQAALKLEGL